MTVWRVTGLLRFTPESGMAAHALAELDQRVAIGLNLHAEAPHAEPSDHEVLADGGYRFDVFLATSELAEDTYANLVARAVPGFLRPATLDGDRSFVKAHECHHDEDPQGGCEPPFASWYEPLPEGDESSGDDVPPEWVQPLGAYDAYQPTWQEGDTRVPEHLWGTDTIVTHNGQFWRCTAANNTWAPGVFGWVVVE